ncbi:histone acetyltransferase of the GNAT family 2 isoform X2 [Tasmannia lanceolata]|uniref:histone acetyltransferase of the GNAT family 2 isoform X2 n=1 Tax=Tasmannia lanceolata TaxID=3420 RepID=UPI004063183B
MGQYKEALSDWVGHDKQGKISPHPSMPTCHHRCLQSCWIFFLVDVGIEANECIKVFLVSNPEEVDAVDSFCIDPIDLNHFFGEDGKIYGYKDLKVNIWLSSKSFHGYADITFQSTFNGAKGITDLNCVLQDIFGESLIEKKEEFIQTFSTECDYIRTVLSNGEVIHSEASKAHNNASNDCLEAEAPTTEVIRMDLSSMPVGELYSRLVPLVLLLVEGGSPVDITDPRWDIYFVVERNTDQSRDTNLKLLGFAAIYRFYYYPDSSRIRISQILVLPPYQGQGHGRHLVETLNSIAVSENVYDVTFEDPSDYLQHVRACIDTLRLLKFEPIQFSITSVASQLKQTNLSKKTRKFHSDPPASVVDNVREQLKINKKQFLRCWEVLIYLNLDSEDRQCMENYKVCLTDRMKASILENDDGNSGKRVIDVPNEYDNDMTFVMFRSKAVVKAGGLDTEVSGNQANQEEQLNQLVGERMDEIVEIAKKVSLHRNS